MAVHIDQSTLTADANRPPPIGLALNKSIYQALHREARALGISTAALIREIIKERMRDPRPLAIDPVYRSDGGKRREDARAA
jgi:hypothetical protein